MTESARFRCARLFGPILHSSSSFIQTRLPLEDRQVTGHTGKPRLRGVQGKVYNLCVTRLGSEFSSPAGSFTSSLIYGWRSHLTGRIRAWSCLVRVFVMKD